MRENAADIVIIGGSTGGCAAALAACRNGKTVVMSEETQWIGGQLTSQTVPPDEHRFIEWFGSSESYRELRRRIRAYYLDNFPVSTKARAARWFNPGNHECSTLACEPRAALAALTECSRPTCTVADSWCTRATGQSPRRQMATRFVASTSKTNSLATQSP